MPRSLGASDLGVRVMSRLRDWVMDAMDQTQPRWSKSHVFAMPEAMATAERRRDLVTCALATISVCWAALALQPADAYAMISMTVVALPAHVGLHQLTGRRRLEYPIGVVFGAGWAAASVLLGGHWSHALPAGCFVALHFMSGGSYLRLLRGLLLRRTASRDVAGIDDSLE